MHKKLPELAAWKLHALRTLCDHHALVVQTAQRQYAEAVREHEELCRAIGIASNQGVAFDRGESFGTLVDQSGKPIEE